MLKMIYLLSLTAFYLIPLNAVADARYTSMEDCLKDSVETAAEDMSMGDLRRSCAEKLQASTKTPKKAGENAVPSDGIQPTNSIINTRLEEEKETGDADFTLTPHRPNFLIPAAYNSSPNYGVYNGLRDRDDLDNVEAKFQLSIKYMLFDNIFKHNGDLYFAYTNVSYWQAYNIDLSSPFRDTSHEPETWIQFETDYKGLGITTRLIQFGLNHQSNGRSEPLSRSWNRIFANFIFEKDTLIVAVKPWWRIPENEDEDNNPDIDKFMGYGEINTIYKWDKHTFTMMFRNNLRFSENNKGALKLAWSFPLYKKLKGYIEYFNGYGQTILDYNDAADTIGVGIALSDIL